MELILSQYMAEALQIMNNYERLSDKRERALKKDIYKFIRKYKNILEWVIKNTKLGLRIDWYEQELEDINADHGTPFYDFIRKLISFKIQIKDTSKNNIYI